MFIVEQSKRKFPKSLLHFTVAPYPMERRVRKYRQFKFVMECGLKRLLFPGLHQFV